MVHGNIVRAAKWLAGGMVGAALVCVIGFHPMVTGRVVKIEQAEPPRAAGTSPPASGTPARGDTKVEGPRAFQYNYPTYSTRK